MKRQDITKQCADSLRSYLNDEYGIKLKSGHAHEIVAACLGYKSPLAMLADSEYPIGKLADAEFIVPDLPVNFVEQRLKALEELPPDIPSSFLLVQKIQSVIRDIVPAEKVYPDFQHLALALAEERLVNRMRSVWRNPLSFDWIREISLEKSKAEVRATVHFGYRTNTGEKHRSRKYEIQLPRIAANLGYGLAEIHETAYSGLARTHSDEGLDKMYPTKLYPVKGRP